MRPKFCRKLFKAPKVKAKVNEILQNIAKSKYHNIKYHGILHNFVFFHLILLKSERFILNHARITWKIH
jgi:hypothetical protein